MFTGQISLVFEPLLLGPMAHCFLGKLHRAPINNTICTSYGLFIFILKQKHIDLVFSIVISGVFGTSTNFDYFLMIVKIYLDYELPTYLLFS